MPIIPLTKKDLEEFEKNEYLYTIGRECDMATRSTYIQLKTIYPIPLTILSKIFQGVESKLDIKLVQVQALNFDDDHIQTTPAIMEDLSKMDTYCKYLLSMAEDHPESFYMYAYTFYIGDQTTK